MVDDQISNPTFINDIVNAIFQTIIMSYEGILHIGSDNYLSRFEFARQFADIFNFNLNNFFIVGNNDKPINSLPDTSGEDMWLKIIDYVKYDINIEDTLFVDGSLKINGEEITVDTLRYIKQ